jgi:hypothetical protein
MNDQKPGITLSYFLAGQPFYYQNTPAFIYRFSADDNSDKRGILITEQGGQPRPVNNIHEQGFTMLVINKPMNVRFKDCFSPVDRLTKNDLLSERPFIYKGNFTHLVNKHLQFNRADNLIDAAKEGLRLSIQTIQDEKFALFMPGYGRIGIYYHECELIAKTSN